MTGTSETRPAASVAAWPLGRLAAQGGLHDGWDVPVCRWVVWCGVWGWCGWCSRRAGWTAGQGVEFFFNFTCPNTHLVRRAYFHDCLGTDLGRGAVIGIEACTFIRSGVFWCVDAAAPRMGWAA
jgi:hypothetical protein